MKKDPNPKGRAGTESPMRQISTKSISAFLAVSLLVIAADQASKLWIVSYLDLYEAKPIIPGLLNLTHVTNTGAAFGFMAGHDAWRHLFFLLISLVALLGLACLYFAAGVSSASLFWGCSLVFGGASGNLVDRIRLGSVIDFVDFYAGSHHWPAFNVADTAICTGGAFLAWHFLRFASKQKKIDHKVLHSKN